MKSIKKRSMKGLCLLLIITVIPLVFMTQPIIFANNEQDLTFNTPREYRNVPKSSLPASNYEWWNKSWTFRIPIGLTAVGNQQDAPVEVAINFTKFFNQSFFCIMFL